MRIFVENLEAYNQGRIVGGWISPLDYSEDDFINEVKKLTKNADEVFIADFDNIKTDEYVNLRHYYHLLVDIQEMLKNNAIEMSVLTAYAYENVSSSPSISDWGNILDEVKNNFIGTYDTQKEFAESIVEETITNYENFPQWLESHIDYESVLNDLRHDYIFVTDKAYNTLVFHSN